jgi:hypothetical protein
MENNVLVFIQNKEEKLFQALACEGIQLEYHRKGSPGKLTFQVLIDSIIDFTEGNVVTLMVNNETAFVGYVFTKKRSRDNIISVTAYDQLRYFKNKHYYWYTNKRADEVLTALAADFRLKIGEIEQTSYVIPKRNEDNSTLFDIVQTALDLTLINTKKMYVLFDKNGLLCLKDVKNEEMRVPIVIDSETAQNYDYESSIDKDTYNRIKIYHDDKKSGQRILFVYPPDSSNQELLHHSQAEWGILQYCESINEKESRNGEVMAKQLFENYCRKSRRLSVKAAFGDIRVRGGSSLAVMLELGDIAVNQVMIVDHVIHRWETNYHYMDLDLIGGDFN